MVFLIGQGAMSLSLLLGMVKMSDIIDLWNKWTHRWTRDPIFMESFDYEKPEYVDVPDGLKWALPIHECLEKPEVKARCKQFQEASKKNRLKLLK
jgi:hypothetical protein